AQRRSLLHSGTSWSRPHSLHCTTIPITPCFGWVDEQIITSNPMKQTPGRKAEGVALVVRACCGTQGGLGFSVPGSACQGVKCRSNTQDKVAAWRQGT